jgi:hypothetical protein
MTQKNSPFLERLTQKARQQVEYFGRIGLDTAARLIELGQDVPALEDQLLNKKGNYAKAI